MSGDWLKMEIVTPDKPETMKVGKILGISQEAAFGHLFRVWAWADQQSLDGNALSVTETDIDTIARRVGIARAMRQVGWLEGQDGCLSFPNFGRHNTESAKKRALTQNRVQRYRSNAPSVTKALPEKRREENKSPPTPPLEGGFIEKEGKPKGLNRWWLTNESIFEKAQELGLNTYGETTEALKAAIHAELARLDHE